MIIGKLDTPITLKRQTFVTNAYGEREVDTTTVQTIWADFTYKNGNTKFEADNLTNTEVIECMIRFRTDIGTSRHYVIAIGSQNYTIVGATFTITEEGTTYVTGGLQVITYEGDTYIEEGDIQEGYTAEDVRDIIIVITALIFLSVFLGGIYMWWEKRKEKRQDFRAML